ncbi:HlyD family efflux transporter periplasmic adaptor subunit [Rhodoferax sp.]|uniref:HlyD family efflux transporter periplasmic adaptor subunit n=1 Tax=Rhodoferax sp. TaxID=50421 RepID=UPI002847AF34|nr:HlyD family efflux transporter periplasmic adaptor subunit [Rhodoferax sp.]MDR3371733.1 HlyD family efflux transporter periplasmic adaptor subunit [Rhodoferax sp.]
MPWPTLREELAIYPGPHLADGQPSWTLQDPVRNQFFRLDWLTFEIISHWSLDESQAIADAVNANTTLRPDAADVEAVAHFLMLNQLVKPTGIDSSHQFSVQLARMRGNWRSWLLHHYLFFRIPLVHPDGWLDRWTGFVSSFYSRGFAQLTLAALGVGLFEVYRDWGRFSATLMDTFSWNGLLGYGATLVGIKVLHELGHAFTAKRYGCRVPAMGVAFLVMFPVAYTDTNEVWKLANRHQRLSVVAAGVVTELVIAVWATLAWGLLPEGIPKSIAFMLATTTWVATLAINTSPFMRFDGYFLLSDWLDMPNLHNRAFALARWDMRERLFDLGLQAPEYFPRRRHIGLILFAYATWIYRLVVFLGIAALVYAFFIKAVGVMLFIVEIGWFVLLPFWSEIKAWPSLLIKEGSPPGVLSLMRQRPRARRSAWFAGVLLLLFIIPWPTRQTASGSLKPVEIFPIYAPAGAQIVSLPWTEGSSVGAGKVLLELTSPELRLRWRRAQARLERLRWQTSSAGVNAEQRQNIQVLEQEEKTAQAELDSVQADMALYVPTAPFNGILRDLQPDLKAGEWVSNHDRLGVLVKPDHWQVETYLDEDAVSRVKVGDQARFFTDGLEGPVLRLVVSAIDQDASRLLPNGQLAAHVGGSIMTREKHGQLVPDRAVYRVTLSVESDVGSLAQQSWRGHVVIHGSWEAPGLKFLRAAMVLVWRELGF